MNNGPKCIGVILDGNRRYARERGLPTLEGHRRGFDTARQLLGWAQEAGVSDVVLYAFSTENWNRAPEEVAYLMDLFEEFCDTWTEEVKKDGGRIRFVGQKERFRESLRARMERAEAETAGDATHTAWVALSYGGRAEILAAVNALLTEGVKGPVDEAGLRARMWTAAMPDPELIIRTSGEKRLSNFLTWQGVYSELFFVEPHLPALTKSDFDGVLAEYASRERRLGR